MQLSKLIFLSILLTLAGCSSIPLSTPFSTDRRSEAGSGVLGSIVKAGSSALLDGDFLRAQDFFNLGLKLYPDHSVLHFLNAYAYHLRSVNGENTKDLAFKGYEMSLAMDPSNYLAAVQVGLLHFSSKQYDAARIAFESAIAVNAEYANAYIYLAGAYYYLNNVNAARDHLNEATKLGASTKDFYRTAAMVYSAAGEEDKSKFYLRELEKVSNDKSLIYIRKRNDDWSKWNKKTFSDLKSNSVDQNAVGLLKTQGNYNQFPQPYVPQTTSSDKIKKGEAIPRWFDCDSTATSTQEAAPNNFGYGTYGGNTNSDETSPLPALPSPCAGAEPPRMVVMDVSIIRSQESTSLSHGINLLSNLSLTLSQSRSVQTISNSGDLAPITTITKNSSSTIGGSGVASGILYSLNIANSANSRNEVIAQPSLMALDRQPSTFFAGRNITLAISGSNGGYGSFNDKQVGVSLSVTPTFIDDNQMLVSVKAARSFVEGVDTAIGFSQSMQTSRNSVSANVILGYDQTLILSGLSEQETQKFNNGVPLLKDVPGLKYLFNNEVNQSFKNSVVVLVTPRRAASAVSASRNTSPSLPDLQEPDLKNKLKNLYKAQFRPEDVKFEGLISKENINKNLTELNSFIYY